MRKAILVISIFATLGSAQAVTIGLTAIANTTVGLVTRFTGPTLLSGNFYLFSSATDLTPASLEGIYWSADPLAFFTAKLGADPGLVRGPVAFTNGAFASSGATEVGAPGNRLYMFIITTGGDIGAFQAINAPALGTVVMNPSNMTEDLLGTSTLQSVGGVNSGYQLGIPEPSSALLSLLGIAPLVRRRR